jgi:hypothetical protein
MGYFTEHTGAEPVYPLVCVLHLKLFSFYQKKPGVDCLDLLQAFAFQLRVVTFDAARQ